MSDVRARALAELEQREALFPEEINRLEAAATANESGFGIHATQMSVLKILMEELLWRQREFRGRLQRDLPDAEFADGLDTLLFEEMAGAQKIWSVFSRAFAARRTPELASHLDTADLVAAECYRLCTSRMRNWGLLDADTLREPPLVCLEAYPEPIALGRQDLLGVLCDAGWRFHDLKLPIPLVIMPANEIECIWLFPRLCHEVGHNVDKDVGLSAELQQVIARDGIAPARQETWQRWTVEILADTLGILLGNAGFAQELAALLLVLAPGRRYRDFNPGATHPHPLLRVRLLGAMLRLLGIPALADVAARFERDAEALPAPDGLDPFLAEVEAIAGAFLGTKLAALGGHALAELNPDIAADVKRSCRLADFLVSGQLRPSPDKPSRFPYRLVPVAAQLAVAAGPKEPGRLADIQHHAMAFVNAIPRPPMLEGTARLTAGRAAFCQRLVREIDFHGRP
jgi:hypothetical protein